MLTRRGFLRRTVLGAAVGLALGMGFREPARGLLKAPPKRSATLEAFADFAASTGPTCLSSPDDLIREASRSVYITHYLPRA